MLRRDGDAGAGIDVVGVGDRVGGGLHGVTNDRGGVGSIRGVLRCQFLVVSPASLPVI